MLHFLNDEWKIAGSSETEFRDAVDAIDSATEQKKISLANVMVNHLFVNERGENMVYVVDPENVLPDGVLSRAPVALDLLDEVSEEISEQAVEDGMMLSMKDNEEEQYLVSPLAYSTLGQRIDLTGSATLFPSLARECIIAEHIGHHAKEKHCTAVIKGSCGVKKIFAFLSPEYMHVPLKTLNTLADTLATKSGLGRAECLNWSIDHKVVQITYAFPEYGRELSRLYDVEPMVPCVKLMTSDTGECSVRGEGLWQMESGDMVYANEYSRTHRGTFDVDEICKGVRQNIFDRYREFPQQMKALSFVSVTPRELDLTTHAGQVKNAAILKEVYECVLRDLGVPSIIGKKRMVTLSELLEIAMIDGESSYSAYAVAKNVLLLPGMMKHWICTSELKDSGYEKLVKAVSKVAYLDFGKIIKKALVKEPEMYLTPEE